MASLDEFYGDDGYSRREYAGRRQPNVPQFESDSSGLFFGSSKGTKPRLFNLDPGKSRDSKEGDALDGAANADHYAGLGIGVAGLVAESLVAHPLVVLRRTCQVSSSTIRHHRTPLTLMPVVVRLYRSQGVPSLWKGFGSSLIVRGLLLTAEDFVAKITPWPKDLEFPSSPKMVGQHLLLKAISLAVVTPFYSVSLIESVQSDIASETPGILDIFKEGFARIFKGAGPRALPMWYLIPSTVTFGLAHYIISSSVKFVFSKVMKLFHRQKQELCGAVSKREEDVPGVTQYRDRISAIVGNLFGDVLLFPLETIIHRLHLQGSRTIIDNLDTGREVLPVTTGYLGVVDCANEIMTTEGVSGFYRGFGALIVQYALQLAIVRISTFSIREIMKLIKDEPPAELIRPPAELVRPTTPPKVATPVTSSSSFEIASQAAPASPLRAVPPVSSTTSRYVDPFASSSSPSYPRSQPRYYNYPTAAPPSDTRYNDPFVAQQQQMFQDGMSTPGRRKIIPTNEDF